MPNRIERRIIVLGGTLICLQHVENSFFSCSSSVGVGSYRRGYIRSSSNTNIMSKTEFVHYDHNDPCKNARWTARECYEFMYCGRPWEPVHRFYLNAVNNMNPNLGNSDTLTALLLKLNTHNNDIQVPQHHYHKPQSQSHGARDGMSGRWARLTFKILLSYHGPSFDGWQKQPGLHTVQSVIELSLGKFVDEKKAQLLQSKGLPIEASVVVAGRTDKGVTALQQVCSFYTWRKDVQPQDIEVAINNAAQGKIRVMSVSQVSRDFHPNFSAEWRRYLYIFPLNDRENPDQDREHLASSLIFVSNALRCKCNGSCESNLDNTLDVDIDCKDESDNVVKPYSFSVRRVNQILQQLEGKLLSYKLFARDTKASRNIGPPTECFVYHARAAEARLPVPDHGEGIRAMCVELVANRFLRKMVRVLVATSIREAAAGAEEDALIKLMDATCRRATAPPAPPDGLCLVDVGYGAFNANSCLIPKE